MPARVRKPKAKAPAAPAVRTAGRVHVQQLDFGAMVQRMANWRDSYNPLRGLSQEVLTRMREDAKRGASADLMWLMQWVIEEDATAGAIVERTLSALSELDWDIKIRENLDETQQALAELQQAKLEEVYNNLTGFRESLEELGMKRIYGFRHLEKVRDTTGEIVQLDAVPPEHFVKNGRYGKWCYNASAQSGAVTGEALEEKEWVIAEERFPVGIKLARLYVMQSLMTVDWQGFLTVYGIPAIFAIMPEGIDPDKAAEFQAIAEQIINNARGALPAGSSLETVTAGGTGTDPFEKAVTWCQQQMVLAGTGGLLTMLAESGSGTLAGGAHMEAWDKIARRLAVQLSEVLQDQVDKDVLGRHFPGEPVLAYFELAGTEENDPDKVVKQTKELSDAGWDVEQSQLEEKTGWKLAKKLAPAAAPPEGGTPAGAAVPPTSETPPSETPAPGITVVENVAPADEVELPPADPLQGLRGKVTQALRADFGEVVDGLAALVGLEPGSDDFKAGLKLLRPVLEALEGAEPGTLDMDKAFEEITAAGLLDGWGVDDQGNPVPPEAES